MDKKITSNPAIELARRRTAKRTRRAGPVNIGTRRALPQRQNRMPKGGVTSGYVKPQRQIGDKMTMYGREYVAFKGGEGGRNWSIKGTIIS